MDARIQLLRSQRSLICTNELMNFDDVKKQLQAKKLNLGLWLQAVIDGEVTPFKLRPTRFTYDIENTRLAHFALHRDQIRQYLSRHCPELNMPASIEEPSSLVD
jgi:hypothetical protein